MENQFAEFYQSFILNSLLPRELEDYNKALKTLNLTLENFLDLLLDFDNHLIEVDGEIIPDLGSLAQSKLVKALGPYDNSKIKKEQLALKNLNQHLLSLFSVVKNHNFKMGLVDEDYNRKIENAGKVLFERFAYLNNTPIKDIEFKGQQSFTFKKSCKTDIFLRVLKKLKDNQLVATETSVGRFQKIFSGEEIPNNEKVDWIGSKFELKLFLINLKSEFSSKRNFFNTTLRCFTIDGRDILRIEEISKASNKKTKEQIIIEIVSIFKIRA
ncbi:hypothetical protein [Flavobacterium sp.]|jgi:hypothetical protein|uniref:hypothetical protein n=1 Tax=Flavobacterium sp. TaxID=239 RepID=UPI0037C031E7